MGRHGGGAAVVIYFLMNLKGFTFLCFKFTLFGQVFPVLLTTLKALSFNPMITLHPFQDIMLSLHYVPGDHGSHYFGHRGRNGVTVTQRRGTGSTNVARRGCRDRRDRFLNSQKNCHGSHGGIDLLKYAVVERGKRNKT